MVFGFFNVFHIKRFDKYVFRCNKHLQPAVQMIRIFLYSENLMHICERRNNKESIMKTVRTIGTLLIFGISVVLLSGCSTGQSATNYPVGVKQKRVNYTATNGRSPVVKSGKVASPPPKNYVVPSNKKSPLYK